MNIPNVTRITQLHELLLAKKVSRYMKYFDTDGKMELLFLIYLHEDDISWGISDYVSAVSSSPQSNSSLAIFVRHLIELGVFLEVDSTKKTRKHLMFSDILKKEFHSFMLMQGKVIDKFTRKKSRAVDYAGKYGMR